MKRKVNKIKGDAAVDRRPPKAKVGRSIRLECTTLPLPKSNQVVEIPQGFEVLERIAFDNFEPKLTLFLRRTNANLFEKHLKSRRAKSAQ